MVNGYPVADKGGRFATPPWTTDSEEWQAIDDRLPADHLARRIAKAVELLNLGPLWGSYLGVGKKALPPDLLLKAVLYEMHSKRLSPAQWTRDARENEPVRWLLFGLEPSRAHWYDFRERLAPFWDGWNAQVLQQALQAEMTTATRVALDSSSVAANASRRKLLNEERLQQRQRVIDEHLQAVQRGQPMSEEPPGWLAKSAVGLREQKQRYAHAAEVMCQRQAANAQRRSDKRKPADQVRVSPADPEAALARDKEGVFRPLYRVQLVRDLDSPLIFAYDVLTQNNDNSVLEPMVERLMDNLGVKPKQLFVDSGYVSIRHLEFCHLAGITLYGPAQENDFSVANAKKPQSNQHTELPKSAFTWLPEEQAYQCPEGYRLQFTKTQTQRRVDHKVTLRLYTCPSELCQACPRQPACTRTPKKGRTVSRMQSEELLDELRARMQTDEAKQLYKRRSRTVEQSFADVKEHRGLRRFHGRGPRRVRAEVGSLVLTHNLLAVDEHCHQRLQTRAKPTFPKLHALRR
jgi:transposase